MKHLATVITRATILVLFAVTSLGWSAPQEHRPPLSRSEVYDLLSNSVPSPQIVADIARYGLAFKPSDAEMDQFRRAGANDAVIEALRHGGREETSHPLSGMEIRTLLATGARAATILSTP